MTATAGRNRDAPVMRVRHADLQPADDGLFKRVCPVCARGILLVRRDQKTFDLINADSCLLCAQQFIYTDETIGGAPLKEVKTP